MPERAKDGTIPSQPNDASGPALAKAYAALEAALSASSRGRWFLAEYARRNRSAETDLLLEAIAKLETAVLKPQQRAPRAVSGELVEMSEAIARMRHEIAQIRPPHQFDKQLISATEELDQIFEATEKTTSGIREAIEEIQEVAWTLRERGTEMELCDRIDQRATDIYTACAFQDITGQRTDKLVKTLRFIEQRINAMIEIWGVDDIVFTVEDVAAKMEVFAEANLRDPLLYGPRGKGEGLKQEDIDLMLRQRDPKTRGVGGPEAALRGPRWEFDRLEPLTFAELQTVKRTALFG